jgi:hypothetical protein
LNYPKKEPTPTTIMLKSYEAIYEQGQMQWLSDQPQVTSARVIVTIIEETIPTPQPTPRRVPPTAIAGKGQTLGDLISPIVDEQDWECLK